MKNCSQLRNVQQPTRQDHIDMLSQPDCWPRSILPLKRYLNGHRLDKMECGVILSSHVFAGYYTVKIGFLFSLPDKYDDYMMLDGYKYNSIEDIVSDGWQVD